MGTTEDSKRTRKRIIEAAGELFAERGFSGVTVREIVKKGKTHLSALNYHFGSKDKLYRAVLLEACKSGSITKTEQLFLASSPPEEALHLVIKEGLQEYRKGSGSKWRPLLLTRECWQPSRFFDEAATNHFKPEVDFISTLVAQLTDQDPDAPAVRFAVLSMIGLTETFSLYSHLTHAVAPTLEEELDDLDHLSHTIYKLVLEAVTLHNNKPERE